MTPKFLNNKVSATSIEDEKLTVDKDEEEEKQECIELDDDVLKSYLGYGHIGVVPLPTRHDDYEQMVVNFRGAGGKSHLKDVSLLIFGGINFKNDESRETFHLQIDMDTKTFAMTYMPNARLSHADRFIGNHCMQVNTDANLVTMVGKHML